MRGLFFATFVLTLAACGGAETDGAGGSTSATGSTSASGFQTSSTGSGADGCSDASRLVYLLGNGRELVRFNPQTLALDQIGLLNCPVQGGPAIPTPVPFSMAVDRGGFAWILYDDGSLFRADVTTAKCTATAFEPHQTSSFDLFGMGFVSDAPGSQAETLYLGAYGGDGIGVLHLDTLKIERVGYYDKVSGAAEMTGTGDARLFGFFLSNPEEIAEIDKDTSKVISEHPLPSVQIGDAWAFAFWGGDFWLFTSPTGPTSKVDRYRPSDDTTTTMIPDAQIKIVGAGVSTCAPVVPPA